MNVERQQVSPIPASSPGPLSEQHLAELAGAKQAGRRLRRASGVAKASAWSTGGLGAITLLGGLFGDAPSLALGVVMVSLSVREALLGARLAALEPGVPRKLAVNQLFLGAALIAYSVWKVVETLHSSGPAGGSESFGDPSIDATMADIGGLVQRLMVGLYAAVAVGAGLGTGLMALYYQRREAMLKVFLSRTPEWIVRVIRTGA